MVYQITLNTGYGSILKSDIMWWGAQINSA